MAQQPAGPPPTPVPIMEALSAYQRTEALRAAIELDLFTAVGQGSVTPSALAAACGAAERGIRMLADAMTIAGFLTKEEGRYGLSAEAAAFLDRRSPSYLGGAVEFLLSPTLREGFGRLAEAVRRGGTALPGGGTMEPEHAVWVRFARAMMPLMAMPAALVADLLPLDAGRPPRVLDVAAGHGLFGIAFARRHPQARLTLQDWPAVLAVARENARAAGVEERCAFLPGSAFEVELGGPYDVVLLANFLHHFDPETCVALLRRVRQSLAEGGRAVTLEFVPNDDRVTPPGPASFGLVMLASTPRGDAYPFSELEAMFREAGFAGSELRPLPPGMQSVVISRR